MLKDVSISAPGSMDGVLSLAPLRQSAMACAIQFYKAVFGFSFEREITNGYDMALFPSAQGYRATGALAKADI